MEMAGVKRNLNPDQATESTRLVCQGGQFMLNVDPNESHFQEDSLNESVRSWRLGISFAILSGVLSTATNFLIQVRNSSVKGLLLKRQLTF